eukprot:scaffold49755_cov46-Cyclotella_meneghiniana.AAC.1
MLPKDSGEGMRINILGRGAYQGGFGDFLTTLRQRSAAVAAIKINGLLVTARGFANCGCEAKDILLGSPSECQQRKQCARNRLFFLAIRNIPVTLSSVAPN